MPQSDEQFNRLLGEAMNGSEEAARTLFEQYEEKLLKVIRRRLHKKVRSKFDSVDFAQDVWKSFFMAPAGKRVFKNPQELLAFLTTLAQNKVIEAIRQRLSAQKYNVNREQSLDDSRSFNKDNLVAPGATPSQVVGAEEEWNAFLRTQPLVYRRIFILLREGLTHQQIAAEVGINVRTVERAVAKFAPRFST
jgi:RNA polymerase sigma factor (sigma-70 family)